MINYNELDNYYIGIYMPVLYNVGGVFLRLGEPKESLFYKVDDYHYVDVNYPKISAYIIKRSVPLDIKYILSEDSLRKVDSKKELVNNTKLVKRLKFNSNLYKK